MAGIFGGLQSLHTDSYDEVFQVPSEAAARIAVATQNILREEAHLTDVIDPLGGSFYVESLTDQMEEKIVAIMQTIDDAGGMYKAVECGLVQRMIGASAMRFQRAVESGEQVIVGVNKYRADDDAARAAAGRAARRGGDAAPPRRVPGVRRRRARRRPSTRRSTPSRARSSGATATSSARSSTAPAPASPTRRSAAACAAISASASRSSSSDAWLRPSTAASLADARARRRPAALARL